jgi:hypothetical protein
MTLPDLFHDRNDSEEESRKLFDDEDGGLSPPKKPESAVAGDGSAMKEQIVEPSDGSEAHPASNEPVPPERSDENVREAEKIVSADDGKAPVVEDFDDDSRS